MRAIWLVLVLAACGGDGDVGAAPSAAEPRQLEAFAVVRDTFGSGMRVAGSLDDAPAIRWSDTLCPDPAADGAYKTAVFDAQGRCYAGLTYAGCDIRVAWRGAFSQSAFAHELMHCLLDRSGRPDPDHTLEPAAWELVGAADRALAARGL